MTKTNDYSASIRRLPEEKLREYIERPDGFHDEAILAALWELASRRPLLKKELKLENEIAERIKTPELIVYNDTVSNTAVIQSSIPNLYSIRSIQIFSVLFSVFAGGILMAINFNRTTQKTEAYKVLGFSLLYSVMAMLIFALLGTQSPILSVVLNLIGAFLIDELFWKRVFGKEYKFNKQQIWTALLVGLIVVSPLLYYMIKSGTLPTF